MPSADLVIANATIYTVDPGRRIAQAAALRDGRFIYVGETERARTFVTPQTRVIDLHGKLVLPAFVDSHCHALSATCEIYEVLLHGLGSIREYRQAIASFRSAHPTLEVLKGGGWSNALFEPHGPTAALLDDLAPDIPVVLESEDYHSAWVNTRALALAGVTRDTPDPNGGIIERDDRGHPCGTLREAAMQLVESVVPAYTQEQLLEGLRHFQGMAHALGITTAYVPGLPGDVATAVRALRAFEASGDMAIRLPAAVEVKPDGDLSVVDELAKLHVSAAGRRFKVNGAKFFMDGVLEGGTAYLEQPYRHRPDSRGKLLWEPARFNEMCAALDRAGLQIHVHSIGDAATRITLDGLVYARQQNGARPARPMITHLQLVNPADIARLAELGVVAVPQPYWFVIDAYYGQAVEYLGQELADRQYPMRSLFDHGVIVASASDYPVTRPPNPLDAMEIGVTRRVPAGYATRVDPDFEHSLVPAERASVEQMIASFTRNGAYAASLEDEIGSIEVGKAADLIILDRNILEIAPTEIHTASVLLTLFEGNEVFRSPGFEA